MSASRSDHIARAEELLKQWEDHGSGDDAMHEFSVELLMAAQAHATLAESMRI